MAEKVSLNIVEEKKEAPVYTPEEQTIQSFIDSVCGTNETGHAKGCVLITYSEAALIKDENDEYIVDEESVENTREQIGLNGPVINISLSNNTSCRDSYLILDLVFNPSERNELKKAWQYISSYLRKMNEFNFGGDKIPLISVLITSNSSPQYLKENDMYIMELINPIYISLGSNDINTPVNRITAIFDTESVDIVKNEVIDKNSLVSIINTEIQNVEIKERLAKEEYEKQERRNKEAFVATQTEKEKEKTKYDKPESVLVGRAAEWKNDDSNQE